MIKVDGTVLIYNNDVQIKVARIRRSMEGEYDAADYIPCTDKDIGAMYEEIVGYIHSIEHPLIRRMTEGILVENEAVVQTFKTHSAAKAMHHGYMGGLLEHTLSVTQICDFMSGRYKYLNRDILLATAMLHDIGKIYELSRMPENDYTDDGQMLGHIVIGAEMITAECAKIPGFPHELASLLKHSILAHHGEYEFGSPKLPGTVEAFVLHCADNMDAKTKTYEETIDQDKTPGLWTSYQKMLGRYVRKAGHRGNANGSGN